MKQNVKLLDWLKSPRLLGASMPTEIIPQGLVSLEIEVAGWGWVQLKGTGLNEPRQWFFQQDKLTLFVPVGSNPTLIVRNLFGRHLFEINAESERKENWISHSSRFIIKPPEYVATKMVAPEVTSPNQLWMISSLQVLNSKWRFNQPIGNKISLPASQIRNTLPNVKLNDWHTLIPMSDLDHRIQQTSIDI
jgi:hypothetical protein